MRKYKVTYIVNGNTCEATFKSKFNKGSKANLNDAAEALANRYGKAVEIVSIRKTVPYEPDGIVLA